MVTLFTRRIRLMLILSFFLLIVDYTIILFPFIKVIFFIIIIPVPFIVIIQIYRVGLEDVTCFTYFIYGTLSHPRASLCILATSCNSHNKIYGCVHYHKRRVSRIFGGQFCDLFQVSITALYWRNWWDNEDLMSGREWKKRKLIEE
jgi:hypothetical protein